MPRLRTSVLTNARIIGNHSGCHQLPERSFFYKGKQFPVCARCTGVFIGQLFAVISMPVAGICPPIISITLLLSMGLDWFVQYIGLRISNNIRRLVTGMIGGFGLFNLYGFFIVAILNLIK